jgi:hypothetical protein
VTWLAANASIREVKIEKTVGAMVVAPLRFGFAFPFVFRDPRMDLCAPTDWNLIVRPAQFEFMIQPCVAAAANAAGATKVGWATGSSILRTDRFDVRWPRLICPQRPYG